MSAPTLPTLTSVELKLTGRDGSVMTRAVPAERTDNEHLAITPCLGEDGLTGSFALTHVPSGRSVYTGRPGLLRAIAGRVAHLDWSSPAEDLGDEVKAETSRVIRELQFTDPSGVELPAHPSWRRGEGDGLKRTALPLMADILANFQWAYNRTGGRAESVPLHVPDPDKPGKEMLNPEWDYLIHRQVDCYGIAYLLGALHRVDPEVADSAAAALADAWDAGDSLGEWAYEWGQALARGEPLDLPGVPSRPFEGVQL